jgi:hypothetical protein
MILMEKIMVAGYEGIAILEWEETGRRRKHVSEHTRITIAARKDSKPVKATIHYTDELFTKRTTQFVLEQCEELSEDEYGRIMLKKAVQDTPVYRHCVLEREYKRMAEARHEAIEREAARPRCPKCQSPMAIRRKERSNAPYWACPKHPYCDGTRRITSAKKIERLKLLGLIT